MTSARGGGGCRRGLEGTPLILGLDVAGILTLIMRLRCQGLGYSGVRRGSSPAEIFLDHLGTTGCRKRSFQFLASIFHFHALLPFLSVCLSICEASAYCSPVFFLFSLFLSRIGVSLSPVKGFEMDGSRAHADEGERASYMSIIGLLRLLGHREQQIANCTSTW